MAEDDEGRSAEEIARRRDETIKRMIATPPKTQKGAPKRAAKAKGKAKRKRLSLQLQTSAT